MLFPLWFQTSRAFLTTSPRKAMSVQERRSESGLAEPRARGRRLLPARNQEGPGCAKSVPAAPWGNEAEMPGPRQPQVTAAAVCCSGRIGAPRHHKAQPQTQGNSQDLAAGQESLGPWGRLDSDGVPLLLEDKRLGERKRSAPGSDLLRVARSCLVQVIIYVRKSPSRLHGQLAPGGTSHLQSPPQRVSRGPPRDFTCLGTQGRSTEARTGGAELHCALPRRRCIRPGPDSQAQAGPGPGGSWPAHWLEQNKRLSQQEDFFQIQQRGNKTRQAEAGQWPRALRGDRRWAWQAGRL